MLLISNFIEISLVLVLLGIIGLVSARNLLLLLMAVEIFFLGASINMLTSSVVFNDLISQFFSLLILVVAASETALGLAFLVFFFRIRNSIDVSFNFSLKG